jgi:hypothetical protein
MRSSRDHERTTVPVDSSAAAAAAADEASERTLDAVDEAAIEAAMATTEPVLQGVDVAAVKQPQRRSRGIAIAIALLALMVAFAAWYAFRTIQKVQPGTESPAPPPSAPASTTP